MSDATGLLLDTHIWVRYINGSLKLKAPAVASIETARAKGRAFLSVISVWEVAMLVKKERLALPMSVRSWVDEALRLPGLRVLPLTPESLLQSVELSSDLNADPSDRMLVATAQLQGLTFLTADKDILRFASKHKLQVVRA